MVKMSEETIGEVIVKNFLWTVKKIAGALWMTSLRNKEFTRRKFSPQRLLLLVKRAVIVISLVFCLVGIIRLNEIAYGGLSSLERYCAKYYNSVSSTCRSSLSAFYETARQESGNEVTRDFIIAAGLPIAFYLGTRLHRFLFPTIAGT